ncbi:MAG: 16S rRNA (cytosine(1402)-N(4))-methyltransferase RsmH [Bryobacteraceae bacterium]
MQHVPVMPAETMEALQLRSGYSVVDATAGLGGHTRLLSAAVGPTGRVFACDTDPESLAMAEANCAGSPSPITFLHTPFSRLRETLTAAKVAITDALLADFGTSMMHFQTGERGFSLMQDGPLDMRLDRTSDNPTAAELVNTLSEKELADLIYTTGERRSRPIARALVRARPVITMKQFASTILAAVPRTGKLHPATLSALSLRIACNGEYREIDALIDQLPSLVRSGGRVVFITFHSGEDLIAKTGTRRLAKEGKAKLINKHVLIPTPEEVRRNPASRSAKMRVLEML